ncbi:sensor histidine kinase [Paenibacillus cremeus]|nr:sensor histidine kinase [Paenibacillus cremeus]
MTPGFRTMHQKLRVLSLRSKLFVILILLSLVPALTVGFMSQLFIVRSSTHYTAAISSQLLRYMSSEINNYLSGVNETLNTVLIDSEFQKFLSVPRDNVPAQAGYSITFRPLLQLLIQSKKEILSVLYVDRLGKVYSESQKVHVQVEYPFQQDPVYGQVFDMTKEGLIAPHPLRYSIFSSSQQVVTFVKPVIDLRKQSIYAWILIEIDAAWLEKLMDQTKLGPSGQVLLFNTRSGEMFQFGEPTALLYPLRDELKGRSLDAEPFNFTLEGKSYQIITNPISMGDWSLIGVAPLDEVNKGVRQARLLTSVIALISFIVALLVAYPFTGIVLRPLYRLMTGMQLLGRGKSVPIEYTVQDEIGFLIKTYNKMLDDLDIMRQEVIQTKVSEKEKELLQLQAQINPHFLFNTLETIESYSLHNNGEAVSDMLQCVSRMMRYNVRKDGGRAPLAEEIKYTEDFLHIHYYRYSQRVRTVFSIEPELLEMPIMKLSIQPFVENALKYGWSPLTHPDGSDDFEIQISVRAAGREVLFRVSDNGRGIADDVFEVLSQLMNGDGQEAASSPFFQQHTGIQNVYRRFTLAHGEQFTMKLYRNAHAGRGTTVEIRLPRG